MSEVSQGKQMFYHLEGEQHYFPDILKFTLPHYSNLLIAHHKAINHHKTNIWIYKIHTINLRLGILQYQVNSNSWASFPVQALHQSCFKTKTMTTLSIKTLA